MKKFFNPVTVAAFLLGAILFSGIVSYAQGLRNGVFVNSSDIGFYDDDKYHAGIYCDPNTGNFVFSSRYDRDVELSSSADIFLNAANGVYVGYSKCKENQVVTNAQLYAEIEKLQKQIDKLNKR